MTKRRLQNLRIALLQPFVIRFQCRKTVEHGDPGQSLASFLIELLRRRERIIPRPSSVPELNGKGFLLLLRRIQTNACCLKHKVKAITLRIKRQAVRIPRSALSMRTAAAYIPGLKAEVLRRFG